MNKSYRETHRAQGAVSRVWRALTDHREFGEWFREKLEVLRSRQLSQGQITPPATACPLAAVVQIDRARESSQLHLAPYGIDPEGGLLEGATHAVVVRLQQTASGTSLLLTESGFDKVPAERRAEAFRMNDGG